MAVDYSEPQYHMSKNLESFDLLHRDFPNVFANPCLETIRVFLETYDRSNMNSSKDNNSYHLNWKNSKTCNENYKHISIVQILSLSFIFDLGAPSEAFKKTFLKYQQATGIVFLRQQKFMAIQRTSYCLRNKLYIPSKCAGFRNKIPNDDICLVLVKYF